MKAVHVDTYLSGCQLDSLLVVKGQPEPFVFSLHNLQAGKKVPGEY